MYYFNPSLPEVRGYCPDTPLAFSNAITDYLLQFGIGPRYWVDHYIYLPNQYQEFFVTLMILLLELGEEPRFIIPHDAFVFVGFMPGAYVSEVWEANVLLESIEEEGV